MITFCLSNDLRGLELTSDDLRGLAVAFDRAQIRTQVDASFSPFGHPTQDDTSWWNRKSSVHEWNLRPFATCVNLRAHLWTVWPPFASPYRMQVLFLRTCVDLRRLASPFGLKLRPDFIFFSKQFNKCSNFGVHLRYKKTEGEEKRRKSHHPAVESKRRHSGIGFDSRTFKDKSKVVSHSFCRCCCVLFLSRSFLMTLTLSDFRRAPRNSDVTPKAKNHRRIKKGIFEN